MSFENPLNKIRKMKAEKLSEIKEKQEIEKEQEIQSQENINTQYELINKQKQGYSEQIIQLKQRISEITGTQSEMIAQYRQTINEVLVAKENETDEEKESRLETLEYIRGNFDEVFGEGKEKWREVGSEKLQNIESQKGFENSAQELDSQLRELHPQTTEGKNGIEEEKIIINKELERNQLELAHLNARKGLLLDDIKSAESFIEYKRLEKETYSRAGALDQKIETDFTGDVRSLKIISDDAKKYTELWDKLKVYPNISGAQPDLPEKLKKAGYTSEEFREKELEIQNMKDKIRSSMGGNFVDFFKRSGIAGPSFPRISMNLAPDIDIFKGSIEELIDKNITLKEDLLSVMNEELEGLNEEIVITQQKIQPMEEK